MSESFASKIREKAKALGAFSLSLLCSECGMDDSAGRRRAGNTVYDMLGRGEVKRIGRGKYRYCEVPSVAVGGGGRKQDVMWRFLRTSKAFGGVTVEHLVETAEAKEKYVREWLSSLVRRGIVLEAAGRWQLVKDALETPKNDLNAERTARYRSKKRAAALAAIAKAKTALLMAEEFILEEERRSGDGEEGPA